MEQTTEHLGTGRRKEAVARVRLRSGNGRITINGRPFEAYFPVETHRMLVSQPLVTTDLTSQVDVRINVKGGGPTGQAGAIRHGISRALLQFNGDLRPALKAEGFLTRDSRAKERKKPGQPGARKRFQFSKR